jgi:DNA-binding SARP family transcriptional activator/streptogramin lyase
VEYRILGPLEVADGDEPVPLGRLKERLVLAVLLLHANEFVSRERLIDELWGESPPPTARKAVNVYVSQLRKALTRNGRDPITTADGGYRFGIDRDELDVARVRQLLAGARESTAAGAPDAAGELLREALALWRGPTLGGLLLESHGRDEVAQLDELRLTALMDRIDCDLALGRHEEVLGELQLLVGEHPLRERLRGQLMLALYRADRQAEALEAYQRARQTLVDDLGIEPSPALQRLQQGILRHDPALETANGTAAAKGPAVTRPFPLQRPERARRVSTRARVLLVALTIAAVAAAASIALTTSGSGGNSPTVMRALPADSIGAVDSSTGAIVSSVSVPGRPARLAAAAGRLWTSRDSDSALVAVDTRRSAISQIVDPRTAPVDVEVGPSGVWALGDDGQLVKVDPVAGEVSSKIGVAPAGTDGGSASAFGQPTPMAVGARSIWIADLDNGVIRVDPATGREIRIRAGRVDGVALGDGAVWAASGPSAAVLRIDPRTDRVTARISLVGKPDVLSPYPYAIAVGGGFVWVVNGNTGTVTKIDPTLRGVVTTIPVGRNVLGLAAGDGAAWVTDSAAGTLVRIDATSNRVTSTPLGPNQPRDVVVSGHKVWVSVQ